MALVVLKEHDTSWHIEWFCWHLNTFEFIWDWFFNPLRHLRKRVVKKKELVWGGGGGTKEGKKEEGGRVKYRWWHAVFIDENSSTITLGKFCTKSCCFAWNLRIYHQLRKNCQIKKQSFMTVAYNIDRHKSNVHYKILLFRFTIAIVSFESQYFKLMSITFLLNCPLQVNQNGFYCTIRTPYLPFFIAIEKWRHLLQK